MVRGEYVRRARHAGGTNGSVHRIDAVGASGVVTACGKFMATTIATRPSARLEVVAGDAGRCRVCRSTEHG